MLGCSVSDSSEPAIDEQSRVPSLTRKLVPAYMGSDVEFSVTAKKLLKKDAITRMKALNEMRSILEVTDYDIINCSPVSIFNHFHILRTGPWLVSCSRHYPIFCVCIYEINLRESAQCSRRTQLEVASANRDR